MGFFADLFSWHEKEAPAPAVEAPAPVAKAPAPVAEAPAPVAKAPAPVAQSEAEIDLHAICRETRKFSPLRKYRRFSSMTQDEVAAEVGVCSTTVSRWESGECAPTRDQVTKLARIYGTTGGNIAAAVDATIGKHGELINAQRTAATAKPEPPKAQKPEPKKHENEIALKPCPFCGAPAEVVETMKNGNQAYVVRCTKYMNRQPRKIGVINSCPGRSVTMRATTKSAIAEAWNRRAE